MNKNIQELEQKIEAALCFYDRTYKAIAQGRYRRVYKISETHVAKVPLSFRGAEDNCYEASAYSKANDDSIPLAACTLLEYADVPVLKMEFVDEKGIDYKNLPDWCMQVDSFQVGHTLLGKLVCFDYGFW